MRERSLKGAAFCVEHEVGQMSFKHTKYGMRAKKNIIFALSISEHTKKDIKKKFKNKHFKNNK